jgi:K+-sensing histidine kinase KdpD
VTGAAGAGYSYSANLRGRIFAPAVADCASSLRFAPLASGWALAVLQMAQTDPNISWPTVAKFVRQLNHDLRNDLNGIELQIAFLKEIAPNDEVKDELKRLREMTGEIGRQMQKLSTALKQPHPQLMSYAAKEFVEDLRAKLALDQPELAGAIEWHDSLGAEAIEIDPALLQAAFLEIFGNAAEHGRAPGPLIFTAWSGDEAIKFSLREPKAEFGGETENWGRRPLAQVRQGHYGLGLFRARGILEAHHGTLRAQFDPAAAVLITTVCLPPRVS